jgi:hypothetical protein
MRSTAITLSAAFVLSLTSSAMAQEPAANRAAPAPAAVQPAEVNVNQLPVDLSRIQRRLRSESARQAENGLNLKFFVDVYAPAPPIVLFTPQDNLQMGPVPYGGPTHREVIRQITPQEHSAPPADFSSLFRWLADRKKR